MAMRNVLREITQATIAIVAVVYANLANGVTNYTDIWFNPSETGWGVTFTQDYNGPIFATFFVYSASGAPIWVVALLTLDPVSGVYGGSVFETAGGASLTSQVFNAAAVQTSSVGTATFKPTDAANGRLEYTYRGSAVVKQITRQPLYTPDTASNATFLTFTPGGTAYRAMFESKNNGQCSPSYPAREIVGGGWRIFPTAVTSSSIIFNIGLCDSTDTSCVISAPICSYAGSTVQSGRVMESSGALTCSQGRAFSGGMTGALTARFYEIEHTDAGVNGKLFVAQGSCNVQSIVLIQRNDWLNNQFP